MARRLAREEGILAGGSAGLNVWLALEIARELDNPDALVVTILCDTGERYLSKVFNDEWMQENQMLEAPRVTVEQLLRAAAGERAGAGERCSRGRGAAGAQPDEHLGREPDPGDGERRMFGGLIEGTLMTRALAQPSLLDRPVREVMEPPFPEVGRRPPTDRVARC